MHKLRKVTVLAISLAFVAAACGSDDNAAGTTNGGAASTAAPAATDVPAGTDAPAGTNAPADTAATQASIDPASIKTDIGVDEDTIKLGLNADLSGIFAPLVTQIVDSQEAYWEIVNDNGGIAGRQVELVILDEGYDVPKHLENYEVMSGDGEEGVVMFSQSTGSPHNAAIAERLVEDNLIAIPLTWYSGWADPEFGKNLFELQTTYCIESMNGVSFMAEMTGGKKIAIISFPGEYGQDGATGAKMAAEQLGLEVVYDGEGAVVPGADQTAVITSLVDSGADIVWATINPTALAEILGGAYEAGFRGKWSGNSPTYNPVLLGTAVGPALDDVYTYSYYGALWNSNDTPGMVEAVAGMREKRPDAPVADAYLRGWIEAMLTQQILEQAAANGDMTRAGVVAAANEIDADFKGLSPNQTWRGEPNDYLVRESYMYDVDLSKFNLSTVSDENAGTGSVLLEGPFASDIAKEYVWDGPCFVSQ